MKYAVIIMRGQPFHAGHRFLVDTVIANGHKPIILLGSANKLDNNKNPYTLDQRTQFAEWSAPEAQIYALNDFDDWENWTLAIETTLRIAKIDMKDVIFYINHKLEDECDFTYKGEDYHAHYEKVFHIENWKTLHVPQSHIHVSGTAVRTDIEANKQFLHPKVYEAILNIKG